MRVRTEERRRQIMDHAAEIFREHGYDGASMAQIAARVGGSKTTLYGYFASKEELFAAVMTDAVATQADALISMIDTTLDDPRPALLALGGAYLDLVLSAEIIKVTRIGIAEGDEAIGAKLYAVGPGKGWSRMAQLFQGWIDRGILRQEPATVVVLHLKGLLEAGVVEPCLYGVPPAINREEAVARAVDVFLRAYAA